MIRIVQAIGGSGGVMNGMFIEWQKTTLLFQKFFAPDSICIFSGKNLSELQRRFSFFEIDIYYKKEQSDHCYYFTYLLQPIFMIRNDKVLSQEDIDFWGNVLYYTLSLKQSCKDAFQNAWELTRLFKEFAANKTFSAAST